MKLDSKLIWRFVRKELKWNVDFYSVQEYLKQQGYIVVFYNTENGDNIIRSYNLSEFAKSIHAFTYKDERVSMVFIDIKLPTANKLYSLLHETAHIYLKHIEEDSAIADERLQEMQADTFAHGVIEYAKIHSAIISALKLSAPVLIISSLLLLGNIFDGTPEVIKTENITEITAPIINTVSETPEPEIIETDTSTVYVTPYGKKFHRCGCRYIKDKKCTTYSRDKALDFYYTPCLVCNP